MSIRSSRVLRVLLSAFARPCAMQVARGETITWTGGAGDGSWHKAGNWDLNRVPGAGDDVVIPDMSPDVTVTYSSGATSINSLTSEEAFTLSGGTLTIDSASELNNGFTLSGSLSGTGDVTVSGNMSWTGGGDMGAREKRSSRWRGV